MRVVQNQKIFQLTASRGGWRLMFLQLIKILLFQLTASRGGWLWQGKQLPRCYVISTHSLTRRLTGLFPSETRMECISTHSLTRRLTPPFGCLTVDSGISTHSLTRRLTDCRICTHWIFNHFNSQPHEEADGLVYPVCVCIHISTHSLTRRLTAILNKNHFI